MLSMQQFDTCAISVQSSLFQTHFNSSINKFIQKCAKLNSVSIREDLFVHFISDQEGKLKI